MKYTYSFYWKLDFSLFIYIPPNPAPMFNQTLTDKLIYLGEKLSFETGPPSEDTVKVDVDIGNMDDYCFVQQDSNTLNTKF